MANDVMLEAHLVTAGGDTKRYYKRDTVIKLALSDSENTFTSAHIAVFVYGCTLSRPS
jgi:hypothetical protein